VRRKYYRCDKCASHFDTRKRRCVVYRCQESHVNGSPMLNQPHVHIVRSEVWNQKSQSWCYVGPEGGWCFDNRGYQAPLTDDEVLEIFL